MPGENHTVSTHVDPVSPPYQGPPVAREAVAGKWWRRRVLPPGPQRV